MLVPMDLRKLIQKVQPCYFIKNVVDYIDCSEANRKFADAPGEFAYPHEFRLVLMEDYPHMRLIEELKLKLVICTWQAYSILVIVQF